MCDRVTICVFETEIVCMYVYERENILAGMLVSNTVPSSREPVYQQLTLSPFLGKLVLSPFFSTDLKNLGGPWELQYISDHFNSTILTN